MSRPEKPVSSWMLAIPIILATLLLYVAYATVSGTPYVWQGKEAPVILPPREAP